MLTTALKRILYVEDETDIQTIVKLSLETIGNYELKVCSSGKEALAEAQNFKPDLFLLDVMMPEMDGPATLKELRKIPELKNIPAVFITAKAQVHEVSSYKEFGVLDIIVKPFDPVQLPLTLKAIWEAKDA
ncbi:MAG: hypothetical protein A2Y25_03220 [Candidatus Melainabacteria bacterium GWF2_37_15]|nr:MAG: hypothetical protein A2Y25_03220 [Candidatus Melainabacteria bacterium GWF2_37_15]